MSLLWKLISDVLAGDFVDAKIGMADSCAGHISTGALATGACHKWTSLKLKLELRRLWGFSGSCSWDVLNKNQECNCKGGCTAAGCWPSRAGVCLFVRSGAQGNDGQAYATLCHNRYNRLRVLRETTIGDRGFLPPRYRIHGCTII